MTGIYKRIATVFAAIILAAAPSYSQIQLVESKSVEPKNIFSQTAPKSPSKAVLPDTTLKNGNDSAAAMPAIDSSMLARRDSVFRADSLELLNKSSLDRPAFSGAKDSIRQVFTDGKRIIYYYGDVSVQYQNMTLKADYVEYDMNTGIVYARGTKDPITGEWKGQPEMIQGKTSYKMEELRYNLNTEKAMITNMVTKDAEGLLQGKSIKMMPDNSINIKNGMYTVCDLEHPHYYLRLSAAKVTTKPNQKTVFGPAWPVIADVPIPLALPFGFIPEKPTRATGMLMPSFGEETSRGMYMRDAGMYFVFGDHLDLSVTGDVYTLGSWSLDVNSRYKINYKCNGNFSLTYSNDQTGEKGSADFFQTKNFGLKWSHTQDSKAHPGTTFSASVNFSSPSNNKYNSHSVTEALQNQISSSVSYSKNWNGKVNLSINGLHSQNSRDSSYTFTLPNITLSVTRFYPFKRKHAVGKERFYEKVSFGYSTSLQNKISFKAKEFNQPGFYDKFQNGMTHNFQIGLPAFTLLNYLNFSPSVNYGMNWFFRKTEKEYNPDTGKVESIDSGQFSHFGITQNYSGSISMSTRLYGMYNFGRYSKVQAIRHVISPSISASFSPEKGTYANGWRTLTYTDKDGNVKSEDYNIYAGQLYSAPSKGKSGTMSISLGNNVEAKVRDLKDTTGTGSKKIKLIDQLNFSTSYNFLADSMKMNNIGVTLSTSIFGKLGISANANFDPYCIDGKGKRYNRFMIQENWRTPVRFTAASFSTSYSFSGKGSFNGNDGTGSGGKGSSSSPADYYQRIYYHPLTGEYIPGGYVYYMNPNVPWSVNFNYSFSYRKNYQYSNNQLIEKNQFTQTLGFSGNIKLTPRMSINATSGFDFTALKLTTTQLSATYDLHCFNIAVSWVPTGTWQSYSFRIAANASALADLLRFRKSSSYWDK